ncbi:hypothetical protein IE81DRAFT_365758 [Ceraceosorus guamensis]|uniref:Small ribosomal subunit protein mS29 n=1 Tax=Ceraceosorus guamensis TaxID=1522189 RepID=A0A316W363_9BASI|nr:hypothetical protein IE81DRAFT_365758 [Ceraceosorus guamensis]PWN43538.1 hypothetical protein IE81DRAFT_365758 [Ceraceosorus guamensis]
MSSAALLNFGASTSRACAATTRTGTGAFGVLKTSRGAAAQPKAERSFHCCPPQMKAPVKKAAQKTRVVRKSGTVAERPRGSGPRRANTAGTHTKQAPFYELSIVRSNLPVLDAQVYAEGNVGRAYAWNEQITKFSRETLLPHRIQQDIPRTILRSTTLQLQSALDQAVASVDSPRHLLVGGPSTGKSHILLQAVSYALGKGYIVAYIKSGINLIRGTSAFVYAPKLQVYAQSFLERRIAESLRVQELLAEVPVIESPLREQTKGAYFGSCKTLASFAASDKTLPVPRSAAFALLLQSLSQQTKVPFLLAIDEAQALYMQSAYTDVDHKPLQAWELSLPRTLLSAMQQGPQRGALMGAIGMSSTQWYPTPALLRSIDRPDLDPAAMGLKRSLPYNPYTHEEELNEKHAKESRWSALDVPPLTDVEARGLWEVKRREGGYWSTPNDELFISKYLESAGNIGAFSKSLVRTSL